MLGAITVRASCHAEAMAQGGARTGRAVLTERCGYAANHRAVLAGSLAYGLGSGDPLSLTPTSGT